MSLYPRGWGVTRWYQSSSSHILGITSHKLMAKKFVTRMHESWLYNSTTSAKLSIPSWSSLAWFLNLLYFFTFQFRRLYTYLRYGARNVTTGKLWTLSPCSGTHWFQYITLFRIRQFYCLAFYSYIYGHSVGIITASGEVITNINRMSVWNEFSDSGLLELVLMKTFVKHFIWSSITRLYQEFYMIKTSQGELLMICFVMIN